MTVSEWIESAAARLEVDAPKLESQMLAAHVLGVDRAWLYAHPEAEFPELAGESVLQRRELGEPLAYILGSREFYGRRFAVDRRVLIPRQETEELVEAALQAAPVGARVLDLGTGSGCIAVTLKLERPDLQVVASDVSGGALEVATANARDLGAEIEFVLSDLFFGIDGRFDLIATNPPYVGRGERLDDEVALHEPAAALYGGDRGEEALERIAASARDFLVEGGQLLTEVGYRQAPKVREMFEARGWRWIESRQDLAGIERVLRFEI